MELRQVALAWLSGNERVGADCLDSRIIVSREKKQTCGPIHLRLDSLAVVLVDVASNVQMSSTTTNHERGRAAELAQDAA